MTDDPARLAAIDQELAEIAGRLDKHARANMYGDAVLCIAALALIVMGLAGPPRVSRGVVIAAFAIVALLAARSFVQGLMVRSLRTEIRDLRARTGPV